MQTWTVNKQMNK